MSSSSNLSYISRQPQNILKSPNCRLRSPRAATYDASITIPSSTSQSMPFKFAQPTAPTVAPSQPFKFAQPAPPAPVATPQLPFALSVKPLTLPTVPLASKSSQLPKPLSSFQFVPIPKVGLLPVKPAASIKSPAAAAAVAPTAPTAPTAAPLIAPAGSVMIIKNPLDPKSPRNRRDAKKEDAEKASIDLQDDFKPEELTNKRRITLPFTVHNKLNRTQYKSTEKIYKEYHGKIQEYINILSLMDTVPHMFKPSDLAKYSYPGRLVKKLEKLADMLDDDWGRIDDKFGIEFDDSPSEAKE